MQYYKLTALGQFLCFTAAENKSKLIETSEYKTIYHKTGVLPLITPATELQYNEWKKTMGGKINPLKIGLDF